MGKRSIGDGMAPFDVFYDILKILLSVGGSFALGALVTYRRSQKERDAERDRVDKALIDGVRTLLRGKLVDAYEKHVTDGTVLTVERLDEVMLALQSYEALGGNGTAKELATKVIMLGAKVINEREDANE